MINISTYASFLKGVRQIQSFLNAMTIIFQLLMKNPLFIFFHLGGPVCISTLLSNKGKSHLVMTAYAKLVKVLGIQMGWS